MTRHRHPPQSRYLQGFSLIELMISLTLGLIITVAVLSAYTGAAGAEKMAEAQGRMNEDAQAALTILTQQLRMAGNNPAQTSRVNTSINNPIYSSKPTSIALPTFNVGTITPAFALSDYSIRGCDGTFSNITTAPSLDGLTCVTDTAKPDSIAVSYEADVFNTVPVGTPPRPSDCLGRALNQINAQTPIIPTVPTVPIPNPPDVSVPYFVADNRFYIDRSSAASTPPSVPSLYCKGNGANSGTYPLVENIEDMQITYGVMSLAVLSRTVAGYLQAGELLTHPTLAGLSDAARWDKVITVRICLLVRSESPVVSDADSARYFKCDGTRDDSPPDLRLRRTYSTTVVLRNRLL